MTLVDLGQNRRLGYFIQETIFLEDRHECEV